jgi:nicotine blue oxidoreductase
VGPVIDIILAAGEGRRMGRNKALVEIGGEPVLTRLLAELDRSALAGAVVVVGSARREVASLARAGGARVVTNPGWRAGQTSSLRAGIAALPGDCAAFLVHPVDHAFTTARDFDALHAAWIAEAEPARAILRPVWGARRGHPVLFAAAYAAEFLALAETDPGHLVYRSHPERVRLVPVQNPLIAHDLDTPEDLPSP